ncbi:MAG: DUF5455 family protein [Shewanella sp.]|nr:DUF5455 family protein [Shewanella sp.]
MAVPALLGIPALGGLIVKGLTSYLAYRAFAKTTKIAFFMFVMGSIYVGVTTLYDQFKGFIAQVALSMPDAVVQGALFLPSNTGTCLEIIVSCEIAVAGFKMTNYILEKQWDVVKEL